MSPHKLPSITMLRRLQQQYFSAIFAIRNAETIKKNQKERFAIDNWLYIIRLY